MRAVDDPSASTLEAATDKLGRIVDEVGPIGILLPYTDWGAHEETARA